MSSPTIYPDDPGYADAGGTDAAFVAAAAAWAADPTSSPKKSAMVSAYTAELTNSFVVVGNTVVLHQTDGTDAGWGSCRSADAATYTAAALNAWLAIPHALP